MRYPFDLGSITVIGLTRSGKSHATADELKQLRNGVLYFNTTHSDAIDHVGGFVDADRSCSFAMIARALRKGQKINFLPTKNRVEREKELVLLGRKLFLEGFSEHNPIYVVVDEVHLYKKEAKDICIEFATTGISQGLRSVWISQRPALIDNTLMTQTVAIVMFQMNMEKQYFKTYSIPYDEMQNRIHKKGTHAFCVWDWKTIQGAYEI